MITKIDKQKDKRRLWKTKLLQTYSVASIILTSIMKRGFAETSTSYVPMYGKWDSVVNNLCYRLKNVFKLKFTYMSKLTRDSLLSYAARFHIFFPVAAFYLFFFIDHV
jgi:hypothetical protein